MTLFTGTSNTSLALTLAEKLNTALGKLEIVRFADDEARVRIEQPIEDAKVSIVQSISTPADGNLMELALIADAVKSADVERITAVVPYLGYSRQDRQHRSGEAVSARVVARMLQATGITKLITIDLHSESIIGFYNIPVVNLSGLSVFKDVVPKENVVVVSPDAGGMKRAQRFAQEIDVPLAFVEKKRSLDQIHQTEVVRVAGNVKGKTAVIVDDIITTGSTLVKAAYLLKQEGAEHVMAFATHPVFVSTTSTILNDSPLEKIYTTDTIPIPEDWYFPKLYVLSVVDLLAQAMR